MTIENGPMLTSFIEVHYLHKNDFFSIEISPEYIPRHLSTSIIYEMVSKV